MLLLFMNVRVSTMALFGGKVRFGLDHCLFSRIILLEF